MFRGNKRTHGILFFGLVLVIWQCFYVMDWRYTFHLINYSTKSEFFNRPSELEADNTSGRRLAELIKVDESQVISNKSDIKFKKILFWNEAYGSKNFIIGLGKDVFRKAGCPVWHCESSDDRRNVSESISNSYIFILLKRLHHSW